MSNIALKREPLRLIGGAYQDRYEVQQNQVGTNSDLLSGQVEMRGVLPTFTDANTIYFKSTGNDTTGTGTFANPYKTFKKAFDICNGLGVAFVYVVGLDDVIDDGGYTLSYTANKSISCYAASGKTITIKYPNTYVESNLGSPGTYNAIGKFFIRESQLNQKYNINAIADKMLLYFFVNGGRLLSLNTYYGATTTVLKAPRTGSFFDIAYWNGNYYLTGTTEFTRINTFSPFAFTYLRTTNQTSNMATTTSYVFHGETQNIRRWNGYADATIFTVAGASFTQIVNCNNTLLAYDANNSNLYKSTDKGTTWIIAQTGLTNINTLKVFNGRVYAYFNKPLTTTQSTLIRLSYDFTSKTSIIENQFFQTVDFYEDYLYIVYKNDKNIYKYSVDGLYQGIFYTSSYLALNTNHLGFVNGMVFMSVLNTLSSDLVRLNLTNIVVDTSSVNNQTLQFNGFKFDGNNRAFVLFDNWYNGAIGDRTIIYNYCKMYNSIYAIINNQYEVVAAWLELNNSIISNCFYGSINKKVIQNEIDNYYYNLFYNIEKIAIFSLNYINLIHNTFNNVNICQLVINSTLSQSYYNNIFNNIYSYIIEYLGDTAFILDFYNSLINGLFYNATYDLTSNKIGNAFFRDEITNDYRLKVIEAKASNNEYYKIDSNAKNLANDYISGYKLDAGCYLYTRSSDPIKYRFVIDLQYLPKQLETRFIFKSANEFETYEGNYQRTFKNTRKRHILQWDENTFSDNNQFFDLLRLIESNEVIKMYFAPYTNIYNGSGHFYLSDMVFITNSGEFYYNELRNKWIEFDNKEFLITGNDYEKLYISNPKGYTLPSDDDYNCIIDYVDVKAVLNGEFASKQFTYVGEKSDHLKLLPYLGYNIEFEEVDE